MKRKTDSTTSEALDCDIPSVNNDEACQVPCTFQDLGVVEVLCNAIKQLKWKTPTQVQREAIPEALLGKDIIGLAETGSGKTGAFALPILQKLLIIPSDFLQ